MPELPGLVQTQFRGDADRCGFDYGEFLSLQIQDFFERELQPTPSKRRFARECFDALDATPTAKAWLIGMAEGAGLRIEDAMLLYLHEENYHDVMPRAEGHCSAFASGNVPRAPEIVVGQNWDWTPAQACDRGLIKWTPKKGPSVLAYNYHGLPFCAGINSAGLALMWTGAGYLPPVQSVPGISTYAVVQELMTKSSVIEAHAALRDWQSDTAGCFAILLADQTNDVLVAEGMPGRIEFERSQAVFRSNLYMLSEIKDASRQSPDVSDSAWIRERAAAEYLHNHSGALSEQDIRAALQSPPLFRSPPAMTLDSLVANVTRGTLAIAPGGESPGSWTEYKI